MKKPVTVTPTKSGSVLYLAAAGPGHSVPTWPCPVTWCQLGQHRTSRTYNGHGHSR